jgi:hypothetical protein
MNRGLCQAWWLPVFAANLVVPLFFAASVTSGIAWVEVYLAVSTYWLAGIYACKKTKTTGLSLIIGGVLVGLSQFWPMLHIAAGALALSVNSVDPMEPLTSVLSGFLATAIVGGILLSVAMLVGFPCAKFVERRSVIGAAKPLGKPPIFDEEFLS